MISPEYLSFLMEAALEEAAQAADADEVPVGAVVARGSDIIGRGRNRTEELQSPIAHAEVFALQEAAQALSSWRLTGCVLAVTVEPCTMCAGALLGARIETVVFGITEPRTGALGSLYDVSLALPPTARPRIIGNVLAEESRQLLQKFFAGVRIV